MPSQNQQRISLCQFCCSHGNPGRCSSCLRSGSLRAGWELCTPGIGEPPLSQAYIRCQMLFRTWDNDFHRCFHEALLHSGSLPSWQAEQFSGDDRFQSAICLHPGQRLHAIIRHSCSFQNLRFIEIKKLLRACAKEYRREYLLWCMAVLLFQIIQPIFLTVIQTSAVHAGTDSQQTYQIRGLLRSVSLHKSFP